MYKISFEFINIIIKVKSIIIFKVKVQMKGFYYSYGEGRNGLRQDNGVKVIQER